MNNELINRGSPVVIVRADYPGPDIRERIEYNISTYLHLKSLEKKMIAEMTECRDNGILEIDRDLCKIQKIRAAIGNYMGLGYVGG